MTRTATHHLLLLTAAGDLDATLALDAQGRILPVPAPAPAGASVPRTVVAVPGECVRTLFLDLPLRNPAQARDAARLSLQGELAGDDDVHLALGPLDVSGKRVVVVVADQLMRNWLQRLQAQGIVADAILPDHLLLPEQTPACLVSLRDRLLVRSPGQAFTAETALAEAVLASHAHAPAVIGDAALALLAHGALQPLLDLQQGTHVRPTADSARSSRRMRLLAALLLVSPLQLVAADALRHELSALRLRERARSLAASVADPALAARDPLAAVEAQLGRLRGSAGFHGLATPLLEKVQASPGVRIERLTHADARLHAELAGADATAAAALREALQGAGISATLENAGTKAGEPRIGVILEHVR